MVAGSRVMSVGPSRAGWLQPDADVRWDTKWNLGDPGAVYEFNIKLRKFHAPRLTDERLSFEADGALQYFEENFLRARYPWVGKVFRGGRSGGWLAVEDRDGRATREDILEISAAVEDGRELFIQRMEAEYAPRGGRRSRRKNATEARVDLAELADLFGLPKPDDIVEDLADATGDVYVAVYREALREKQQELFDESDAEELTRDEESAAEAYAEEQAQKAEHAEADELYRKYTRAVEAVAEHFFGEHDLLLEDQADGYYVVLPGSTWESAADHIRTTINGVGMFEFADLEEFLQSGPYTAEEAVLSHLHWLKRHADVYGDRSASNRFDRAMR